MAKSPAFVSYRRVAIIGIGLIGSSLARAIRARKLAGFIAVADKSAAHRAKARKLGLADALFASPAQAVRGADLVILATPVRSFGALAQDIAQHLAPGATLTDVGSVKRAVIQAVVPHVPKGVHFIPGHPIAGTEHSGPEAGFAELFEGRWCLLTPLPRTDAAALARLRAFWEKLGAKVDAMDAAHHDKVLAITSHLPHLIAYTIIGTADDLSGDLRQEVIRYSASGFHDFTRVAASDPVMWRDIFLTNGKAVLEIAQRFTQDLTALERAIRRGEGETLEKLFTRSRAIRRGIVTARQAEPLARRSRGK